MTRSTICLSLFLVCSMSALGQSQKKYAVYGQIVEDRASTRLGYWRTDTNAGVGEVVVSYGRPVWKSQYASQLDGMTNGKMWRMGDNYWSLLDTTLPVSIGGRKIDPGHYYLAVERSKDGSKWELVFVDSAPARKDGLDAYDVGTRPKVIPVLFKVPLEFQDTSDTVERLTMLFKLRNGSDTDGSLTLTWGNFSLSTPVIVELPAGY